MKIERPFGAKYYQVSRLQILAENSIIKQITDALPVTINQAINLISLNRYLVPKYVTIVRCLDQL